MSFKQMCAARDIGKCSVCSKKILAWTILGNSAVSAIKLAAGAYANSSGLIADGFQSISCVATSVLIMASLAFSQRKSDAKFPYGYAKIEFIVAFFAFSILIGLGLSLALISLLGILRQDFSQPNILVLPVVAASAFLTYMMYRYNFCAGTKLDSPGMIANGAHAGADLFSSGAVILGIILAQFGEQFFICDKIAALFVGIIIVKDSLEHWLGNLKMVLDKVPDSNFWEKADKIIQETAPGYKIEVVKFKRVDKKFWIGLGLRCPMDATVQDFRIVIKNIKNAIINGHPEVRDVDLFIESGVQ